MFECGVKGPQDIDQVERQGFVSSSPEGIVSRDVILIFETAIVLQPSICFG